MQKDKNSMLKYYFRGLGTGLAVSVALLGISGFHAKEPVDQEAAQEKEIVQQEDSSMTLAIENGSDEFVGEQSRDRNEVFASEEPEQTPEPVESVEPTQTSEPMKSEEPTQTTEPVGSEEPTQTSEPMKSEEPTQTSEPVKSEEPAQTSEPVKSEEPAQTTEPVGSEEPTQTSEPVKSEEPTQTTEPVKSEEPAQTVTPGERENAQNGAKKDFTLTVKKGYSSWSVAKILAEAGVVNDAKAYDEYLCANGYDKRISVGSFVIPAGSSEEEIAKLITGSN